MKKHRNADGIILLASLFAVCTAGLIYNLYSAENGEIAVSFTHILGRSTEKVSAVSAQAEANLLYSDTAAVFADADTVGARSELLPPVVVRN